ncbi:MAG: GrpB family protein [Thermomicrobiales bacterium]|nr:GrpB family protein [Thermomicrobiales bacterium]MCO5223368.1 GrpB family protein [Thermomicrobiales bacterium]
MPEAEVISETGRTRYTDEEKAEIWIQGQTPLNSIVELAEYDPDWPNQYETYRRAIVEHLGDKVVLLEHVGSTSVPGLAAKPRIDILLVVADSSDEAAYVPQLEAAGFELHVREANWHEHRCLKGVDPDANLHVFSPGCVEIERMIGFRDWLRTHDDDRQLYETTKRELAVREWDFVQDYADAKSAVVEEIRQRAGLPEGIGG